MRDPPTTAACPPPPAGFVATSILGIPYRIGFSHGSDTLDERSTESIRRLISEYFSTYLGHTIALTGFRRPSEPEELSIERARLVAESLEKAGIEPPCIAIYDGGTEGSIPPSGSGYNGRVEVRIELLEPANTPSKDLHAP